MQEINPEIVQPIQGAVEVEEENTVSEKWTNVQVDSTVLSMFMSCPQKYEYSHERQLQPIEGVSKSIMRGTIVHDALLQYWKARIQNDMDYQPAVQAAISTAKASLEKEIKFDSDERLDTLSNLLEFLRFVQSLSWIPLEAEKFFRIKIYENAETRIRIFLTGRIDLIIRTPQIPVLPIDFKTESERWFYSQMSNQFRIYSLACRVNLVGVQRVGFQKSFEPKDRFKLEMLPFDVDILEEYRTITLPFWVNQLLNAHRTGYFPMNTTNCVHGHFKCIYSDAYNGGICNVSRSVREQKLKRYFVVGESWSPEN